MSVSRRQFLATTALAPWWLSSCASAKQEEVLINGHIDAKEQHYVSGFTKHGAPRYTLPLPDKAHGFAIEPGKKIAVSLPSLPGTRAPIFDIATGELKGILQCPSGRHFNGHGCFSADGTRLFACENIAETAQGLISVWDVKTAKRIREMPTQGIGPHDLRLLPDGKTLVVANGGIQTHPSSGKHELNINHMRSSLVFLDTETGELLAEKNSPYDKLSMRHLDINVDGTVLVACQYKGRSEMPPLVGIQKGQSEIEFLDISDNELWPLNNYTACGRITDEGLAAVTCPRGNRLTLWDTKSGKHIKSLKIEDVGGIELTADGQDFMTSAKVGELYRINTKSFELQPVNQANTWSHAKWTNHMKGLSA